MNYVKWGETGAECPPPGLGCKAYQPRRLESRHRNGIIHERPTCGNRVELLDRKRWKTRLELTTAIFEYLEIFHNRQRRHSALGMLTPVEYEMQNASSIAA